MSAAPRRGFTGGKRAKDARGTLNRLIGYIAKGNKARLVCVFILLIISTVASVSASLFLKSLIDDYIAPLIGQSAPSFAPLLQALTMMGCIYLAGMLFGPMAGALVGFSSDLVGCLFSGYGYNPLFCLPPSLYGVCGGLLRRWLMGQPGLPRLAVSFLRPVVLGSILWQSFARSFVYG